MSRSLMSSFSRPSLSRKIQPRTALQSATRVSTLRTKPLREHHFLDSQVFQVKARSRGRRSSGKKPDEEEDSTEKEEAALEETPIEPIVEETPIESAVEKDISPPEPPSFEPEPSVVKEEPVAEAETQQADASESAEEDAVSPWKEDRAGDIRTLKATLISSVAGFDRGFAAVAKDVAKIRNIVERLETLSGSLDLTGESKTDISAQDLFDGTWKLVFSSAFAANAPRPTILALPVTFGPVYQVVNVQRKELDNVVELLLSNVPRPPWAPSNAVPKIRLTLRHDMSFSMSIVSLTFKETIVDILDAGFDIPKFTIPSARDLIRSVTGRRSDGEFSLVYLDEDLRITEGDRSELRIFVKIADLE